MTALQMAFLATAALTLLAGWMTVSVRNLVHAALWMIVAFFGVAVIFVLLEAGFLAVVQVVLYIGAIAILIIFAVMLTRRVMQDTGTQVNRQWWAGALVAGIAFAGLAVLFRGIAWPVAEALTGDYLPELGVALVDPNRYAIPFEVASVLLLAALIGSIAVAGEKS